MKPTLVRCEAPPFGVGGLWLDGACVLWSELPRSSEPRPGTVPGRGLAGRSAGGIGSYRALGIDYERRLPALEGVTL